MAIVNNRKAFFNYEILDKYVAGMVLEGSEVKAIRNARINIKDGFVKIIKNEAFLFNVHISSLNTANLHFKPNERRPIKLLLNKREINKLFAKTSQDSLTIVPLSLFFNARNKAKIEIALAKGKNLHDKRESIKEKEGKQEALSALKNKLKGL